MATCGAIPKSKSLSLLGTVPSWWNDLPNSTRGAETAKDATFSSTPDLLILTLHISILIIFILFKKNLLRVLCYANLDLSQEYT